MKKTIIALVYFYLVYPPNNAFSSSTENVLEDIQREITELVEIAKPSVVTILSKSSHSFTISKDNGIFSFLKNHKEKKTIFYKSICSGLIYNEEGYIITKSSIINEYEEIEVILCNGNQYKPIYIGRDQETGITVLKIEAEEICPSKISNSDRVAVGSWITIIGNSMGVSPSISFGLVNGILTNGLIQISAIVSPGNSGSPVFDINGNVVGILAAQIDVKKKLAGNNDQNLFTEAGVAFPITKTCAIADEIIKSFREQVGWIGIQLMRDSIKHYQLTLQNVILDSPAEEAGLKKGDALIKYNNISLQNSTQLGKLIKATKPGSIVPICFIRDNTRLNVFVTVGKRKPFIGERLPQLKIDYEGYYLKTFQTMETNDNVSNVSKLQNKVRRLEQEIFQLKTMLINKQKLK